MMYSQEMLMLFDQGDVQATKRSHAEYLYEAFRLRRMDQVDGSKPLIWFRART